MEMEKIKLFKKRTFGETIGTAFDLLRQNFRIISMSFLIFVMPLVLLSLLTLALGFVGGVRQSINRTSLGGPSTAYIVSIVVGYFAYILTFFIQSVVLHEVIIAYESSNDPRNLRVSEVWTLIKADLGRIVGSFFALLFFGIALSVIGGIIGYLGGAISSSAGGLTLLIIYLVLIYLQVCLSNYLMLTLRSEYNVITAIGKSISLAYGRWWRTFGIMMIMGLVTLSFYSVSLFPFSIGIYLFVQHNIHQYPREGYLTGVYIILGFMFVYGGTVLAYLGNLVILGSTVNYYSLIEEKEHVGFYVDIEQLGIQDTVAKTQEGDY